MVFVNRVGEDDGFAFWGGSHVVDFDGHRLVAAPEDVEAVVWADLDLGALRRRRRELPLLDDPRLDILAAGFGDASSSSPGRVTLAAERGHGEIEADDSA